MAADCCSCPPAARSQPSCCPTPPRRQMAALRRRLRDDRSRSSSLVKHRTGGQTASTRLTLEKTSRLQEEEMRAPTMIGSLTVGILLVAAVASSQQANSGISGVVRDTSGGVLPGVAVEAASPALIEKVRSATTDGEGRYSIVDLRPGIYTVTFTLTGFATVRREGVDLPGGFTATVNGE